VTVPESEFAAFVVLVSVDNYPNTVLTQLDVRIESEKLGKRLLIESFAGVRPNNSERARWAMALATSNYCRPACAVF
jgi:hypothetical protein